MRFIIADTTVLHIGRGDFVLPPPFRGGILSGGILSEGDYVQGGFCPFPMETVRQLWLRQRLTTKRDKPIIALVKAVHVQKLCTVNLGFIVKCLCAVFLMCAP